MSSIEQNKGTITTALNAIPYIGPALASVFNIVEGIFGGGDPTPLQHYWSLMIQARLQMAAMHRALGVVDDFRLPLGFTGSENEVGDLAMLIINDVLRRVPDVHAVDTLGYDWSAPATASAPWKKVWPAYQGSHERSDTMSALKNLAGQIGTLQLEIQNSALAPPSSPTSPTAPSGTATDDAPPGVETGAGAPGAPPVAQIAGNPPGPGPMLIFAAIVLGLLFSAR
jgi:hypothetical protein